MKKIFILIPLFLFCGCDDGEGEKAPNKKSKDEIPSKQNNQNNSNQKSQHNKISVEEVIKFKDEIEKSQVVLWVNSEGRFQLSDHRDKQFKEYTIIDNIKNSLSEYVDTILKLRKEGINITIDFRDLSSQNSIKNFFSHTIKKIENIVALTDLPQETFNAIIDHENGEFYWYFPSKKQRGCESESNVTPQEILEGIQMLARSRINIINWEKLYFILSKNGVTMSFNGFTIPLKSSDMDNWGRREFFNLTKTISKVNWYQENKSTTTSDGKRQWRKSGIIVDNEQIVLLQEGDNCKFACILQSKQQPAKWEIIKLTQDNIHKIFDLFENLRYHYVFKGKPSTSKPLQTEIELEIENEKIITFEVV